jgi:hypothetical protein
MSIEEFKNSVDLLGDAGGPEVSIVAQFLLDLAVSTQFSDGDKPMSKAEIRNLLKLRIARHRSRSYRTGNNVH